MSLGRSRAVHDTALLAEVGRRVRRVVGKGMALQAGTRAALECALGANLAAVRIHSNDESDWLAAAVGADAFTCGADIFFRFGVYNPGTTAGMSLLAHEMAHAVQQAGARSGVYNPEVRVSHPSDADELAAANDAWRVVRGQVADRHAPRVQVRRLADRDPVFIQRHASWEHRLLGDAPKKDLNQIALNESSRKEVLKTLREFYSMWATKPEDVSEDDIKKRYSNIRTLRLKTGNLLATYGELNTLPDYIANPHCMDLAISDILLRLLQSIRKEGYHHIQKLLDPSHDTTWATTKHFAHEIGTWSSGCDLTTPWAAHEIDKAMKKGGLSGTDHYTAVLARNGCHFAPYSWYRWEQFYTIACEYAKKAYEATDSDQKANYTYQAWMNHSYADHFLQDSFAAGHLINKTLVMQWFVEWIAYQKGRRFTKLHPVADWDKIKTMTTVRQPGLAARGLYNPDSPGTVRDPQTAEEQQTLEGRMATCGIQADGFITQADAYKNYLAFLNSTAVQAASGVLHDFFNNQSVTVSTREDEDRSFVIWGDSTMLNGGDGVGIASDAAHASQQSIADILKNGSTSITVQNIRKHFPTFVWVNGNKKSLEEWNDSLRDLAFGQLSKHHEDGLFEKVPYSKIYNTIAFRHIGNVSVDQYGE
jgi:hypothetical protein